MNRKSIIVTFTLLFITAIAVFAFSYSNSPEALNEKATIEQVSTENPAHCDPSNCTPEQKAKCAEMKGEASSNMKATANGESTNNCPQTKECPASKCSPDKKMESATL